MDARESDLAIKVIGRMAQTDELRCQQLQEAWAKNERLEKENETLRLDFNEAMRQYDAQQKRACDAEAENKRLREALEKIATISEVIFWWVDENDKMPIQQRIALQALKGSSNE